LDDLDDHRRNVAELERTRDAVDGLLRVYRDYCTHDLHDRVDAARQQAARASDLHRSVGRATDRAARAAADVERIEAEISRLVQAEDQLRTEIDALKASRAYQSGQELEGLRQLV